MDKKPILITHGIVCLPKEKLTISVGRTLSKTAVLEAFNSRSKELIVVSQSDIYSDANVISVKDLYANAATLVKIVDLRDDDEGDFVIDVEGLKAVSIDFETTETIDFNSREQNQFLFHYDPIIKDEVLTTEEKDQLTNINLQIFEVIRDRSQMKDVDFEERFSILQFYPDTFPYHAAHYYLPVIPGANNELANLRARVDIMSQSTLINAYKRILSILFNNLIDKAKMESDVRAKISEIINDNLQKQQKEFYLREQLKVVKEQLGELSSREDDASRMRAKIKDLNLPVLVKEHALAELNRFEAAMSSNESSIIKSYLDWLLDLPWGKMGVDNNDLNKVRNVLEKNHYGISKVKERILEYLALRMRNKNIKGPIICLVGPPGVGKTSLVYSIAEAMNKKFVKVSLGGVRDEGEIRGHRKTYVGAMPGRIIKGLKKAGVDNPLFLLDEIDKMTSDNRGDPSAALLEVLDPEQNKHFSDNYIEEEYNLSNVMFMATANYYEKIPYALIDRLEIIELSSYTAIEKREIAKEHLLKRIFNDARLKPTDLVFSDEVLDFIIEHYTKEAGVRELDRQLGHIVRKFIVEKINEKELSPTILTKELIIKYLGKIKFDVTQKESTSIPGVVNGMAYTQAGGDLLPIEVNFTANPKGGNITITGNLERTMSESVRVALGFVKANAQKYGIDEALKFNEIDIHVHVPSGGVPKDGPSAGIALTTAIISALSKRPVRPILSMTGEIMLRGTVGIIGGVKEKVISAHRAGVREIILPADDERFLEDVPQEVRKDLKIHLAKHYDEVYEIVFGKN
ncbi:endopeptidase La [Ureaplasma zalophigenitalium]|uniref:Lon protease n=1 Tax=Ureaplasma zalophigenitalium TaxID=907723 RepID=A0ABT3BPC4_9BACT|nr:endopeptidase La [Ureaplasma zalophigenitalium]MCV3754081.1 endopeptidase La [Ureaplasma zalophigenitalium]